MVFKKPIFLKAFIFILSFISAIPTLLTWHCLNLWLASLGYNPQFLSSLSLMGLPFSFKLIITPIIEHVAIPGYSNGKHWQGWLIISALLLSIGVLILGQNANKVSREMLIAIGLVVNLATIFFQSAFYFLKLELVHQDELASGLFAQRVGLRAGHSLCEGTLILIAHIGGWSLAYKICSIIFFVVAIFLITSNQLNALLREQAEIVPTRRISIQQIKTTFNLFAPIFFLAFLINLADDFISPLVNSFYLHCGYTQLDIVSVAKFWGTLCVILGGYLSLFFMERFTLITTLWWAALAHAITLSLFPLLNISNPSIMRLAVFIFFKNLTLGCKSLVVARFFAEYIKKAPSRSLLYSLIASMKSLALACSFLSGLCCIKLGWNVLFILNSFLSIPALVLLTQSVELTEQKPVNRLKIV